jgi:SAM-dependent methyltransferase
MAFTFFHIAQGIQWGIYFFVLVIAVVVLFFMLLPLLRGAPFVPLYKKQLYEAFNFLQIHPGQTVVDLGCGEGRIVIEAARKGARAVGYDINPFLVFIANKKIKQQGLSHLAHCYWKDFWRVSWADFDVVFVYGISNIMKRIEKKAQRELKAPSKIVCFIFPLPSFPPVFAQNGVYIYQAK